MPNNITVVGQEGFGGELAKLLGCRFIPMERRVFPDGEVCPRIEGKPENRVVLASRMKLPIDPNSYFVETALAANSLKTMGCEVWLAMPYLVYSRQDKSFREGEPHSLKNVVDLLARSGVTRIFAVSSHADRDKPMITAGIPVHNIDGYSLLGGKIKSMNLGNPMVVGADMSVDFAAGKVADSLGCHSECLMKKRDLSDGSIATNGSVNVSGKNVVIVDDIISSGGTMANAAKSARASGAASITIAAVHLTKKSAITKLRPLSDSFFTTDTIENPLAQVSVVPKIAETIKKML